MQRLNGWRYALAGDKRLAGGALVALALAVGVVGGILVSSVSPLFVMAGVLALPLAVAVLLYTQVGLLTFVGVAFLLPFAVIPLPLGPVKLTFIDATLTALLAVWLIRLLARPEAKLQSSPLNGPIALFILLAFVSFAGGTSYALSPETARLFLKIINSILLFFTVLNVVMTKRQLEQIVVGVIVAGFGAAVIGIGLYLLPAATSVRWLSALRYLGYPSGPEVLRYIAGTDILRATGTSIDPNILGSALMLSAAIAINQLLSPKPILPRRWMVPMTGTIIAGLLLTLSRSAWMGLAVAVVFIATVKYRRLWVVFVLLGAVLYFGIVPEDQRFIGHLTSGLQARDQAAAMRLGEYKDALRLITRYPWFGVGFGSAPSIDLYIGVSNIYLLVTEEMGFIGLASFLLIMGMLLLQALRALSRVADAGMHALLLGNTAVLVAALTAGIFDHHFFNLKFPHTVALFWLFVGLTMVAVRLGTESEAT